MNAFVKKVSQKITKLAPEQVEKLFDQLVKENDSLLSVFESLSTGLFICDEEWHLLLANKRGERLIPLKKFYFEQKQQDFVSDEKVWQFIDDDDIVEFLIRAKKEKKINTSEEFVMKTSGGSARFIVITLLPLIRNQKICGTIIKIDDITEKRNQETLLHRMESLASLTNLAANVAHEIKNPLGSIGIYIQLIQKAVGKAREGDGALPDEKFLEKYLDVVNQEIDRLNSIVVDFLFAVRPLSAELIPTNLLPLLQNLAEFFKPELEENNIQLETAFTEKTVKLLIDEKLFKQAAINLVQNAIAAMPNGGHILLSSKISGDKYLMSITDTGKGMDDETVRRVFEPYFTTKTTGTGLGLTMVYKVVKEFGGDIDLESTPGKGTCFTITLPIPQTEKHLLENVD